MSSDHEWGWQQQCPVMDRAAPAGLPATMGTASMNRADATSDIHRHPGRVNPDTFPADPRMATFGLGDEQYQLEVECAAGSAPIWGPQPGTADAESYGRRVGCGIAGQLTHDPSRAGALDSSSASLLAVSEGRGAFTGVGNITSINESEFDRWPMSARATGVYDAQQKRPNYPDEAASTQYPYDPQLRQCGVAGEFKVCHGCGLCLTVLVLQRCRALRMSIGRLFGVHSNSTMATQSLLRGRQGRQRRCGRSPICASSTNNFTQAFTAASLIPTRALEAPAPTPMGSTLYRQGFR